MKKKWFAILLAVVLLVTTAAPVFAEDDPLAGGETAIVGLTTEALEAPLAIDNAAPGFSWRMESNLVGIQQNAYRVEVATDPDFAALVWDSGMIESDDSIDILYGSSRESTPLQAETDYYWRVTVTDNFGQSHISDTAFFATGLMNPNWFDDQAPNAWEGADFIGIKDLMLDANAALVFDIQTTFKVVEGDNISFIFGADDPRFNYKALNVFDTEGENFIRLEFDLSAVTAEGGGMLNIYRKGYHYTDSVLGDANVIPYKSGSLGDRFTTANKNAEHTLRIQVSASAVTIAVDGANVTSFALTDAEQRPGTANANVTPNSTITQEGVHSFVTGNNNNTFPNLCSVGFQVNNAADKVEVTDYRILDIGGSAGLRQFDAETGATYSIFTELDDGIAAAGDTITITGTDTNAGRPLYANPSANSLTYLRTGFETGNGKTVAKARLYATALGGIEMYLNGQPVGEDWFAPGLTQYRELLNYNAYDVTGLLQNGANTWAAIVGEGFYGGWATSGVTTKNYWGDYMGLMAKLVITYTDGTRETVVTNTADWKAFNDGPMRYGSMFQGATYDARKEAGIAGWTQNGFDMSGWETPETIAPRSEAVNFALQAQRDTPVRLAAVLTAEKTLTAYNQAENDTTTYTYDMGTTLTGVPRITIPAGVLQEGDEVIIRYGEQIYPGNSDSPNTQHKDGYAYEDLYGPNGGYRRGVAGRPLYDTYRGANAMDTYIAKQADAGGVVIEPHFTFRSYRYVQVAISGGSGPLPVENVQGLELSSIEVPTGTYNATTNDTVDILDFETTGDMVNQFFDNTKQSQLGNFFSIPTDCPQRNERQGWTGDIQVYSRTATYHSTDAQNFLTQWMQSLRADQNPVNGSVGSTSPRYSTSKDTASDSSVVWGGAIVMAPWQLYQQYGDLETVKESYTAMKMFIDYRLSDEYRSAAFPNLSTRTNGLADHVGLDGCNLSSTSGGMHLLNNALQIYLTGALATMAEELGKTADAAKLRAQYEASVEDFNKAYFDPETGMTLRRNLTTGAIVDTDENFGRNETLRTKTGKFHDTQSSYAYPLYLGIVSDTMTIQSGPNAGMTYREFAAKRLAELIADPTKCSNGQGVFPNTSFALSGGPYISSELPFTVTSGFAATPGMLPALSANGQSEVAYALMTNADYATWLYPVSLGSTSMWELWDSYDRALGWAGSSAMNSFNHFALGGSAQWLYEYSLGITSGGNGGYQNFVLQPTPGGSYTALDGGYSSNYGRINSAWTAQGNGEVDASGVTVQANQLLTYSATVPANTTATLYLPVDEAVMESYERASGVKYMGMEEHNGMMTAKFGLVAGGYDFAIENGTLKISLQDDYVDTGINFDLTLSTRVQSVVAGEYFEVNAAFDETQPSNVIVLNYSFDGGKFEYDGYAIPEGGNIGVVEEESGEGWAKVTLMIPDYAAGDLGNLKLHAKDDAVLAMEKQRISVEAEYVLKDAADDKSISIGLAGVSFTTLGDGETPEPGVKGDTNGDRIVDLIDLSNMIDWFGFNSSHVNWETRYIFFDFNNNGMIDIYDISYVARLIA